jgi:hypothetical protein
MENETMSERSTFLLAALASGALAIGCSNSEAPAEDHTPVTFSVTVNNVLVADDTVRLTSGGQTDTVHISFFNAASENLDHAEADHYSALTFTPAANITATMDPSHHFRHGVVTTAVAGTVGTLDISYGHDALADEYTFSVKFKVE